MICETKIRSRHFSYIPLFGDIKHDDNAMCAFVYVNKICIQTCIVCDLKHDTACDEYDLHLCASVTKQYNLVPAKRCDLCNFDCSLIRKHS